MKITHNVQYNSHLGNLKKRNEIHISPDEINFIIMASTFYTFLTTNGPYEQNDYYEIGINHERRALTLNRVDFI